MAWYHNTKGLVEKNNPLKEVEVRYYWYRKENRFTSLTYTILNHGKKSYWDLMEYFKGKLDKNNNNNKIKEKHQVETSE